MKLWFTKSMVVDGQSVSAGGEVPSDIRAGVLAPLLLTGRVTDKNPIGEPKPVETKAVEQTAPKPVATGKPRGRPPKVKPSK